ncbi:mandelate racemase/muconate lactonizing enzyme family protein [Agromyces sp. NPDC058110]|uniref:mandelate racemase/muconate lactonizing enzyme family protein n=1 Tax=Agromyces sp. NPDC058110 TaxID=3346345 RepID=UPI0036DB8B4D
MSPTIRSFDARLIAIPLSRPWGVDVTSVSVVATRVELSDGVVGHGFSWTPTIGGRAVLALLQYDIHDAAIGRDADPAALWPQLWRHLHEAGGGGLTTIALAGLDLALWDAAARRSQRSITDLLGRRHDRLAAYGSGVNLHYSTDELLAQVERWIAAGFDAVKIKVGRPRLADDVERVRQVRRLLGDDRRLMIDANQRWTLDRAVEAMRALDAFDPAWIEEPLVADDLASHAELARRIGTPIAVGENLHTRFRFDDAARAGVGVVQPNVVRVGGITPLLDIAADAADRGLALHPHLLPELSGQVALALPGDHLVEDVEDAAFGTLGALEDPSPVEIDRGTLRSTDHVGLGLRFRGGPR